MRLTKNLTLKEACRSESAKRLGIDNSPNQDQLDNLKITAEKIFQPIRDHFKCPVYVSSMFRSPELNNFLRLASKTSLHMSGQAIDIDMDGTDVSNEEIFNFVKDNYWLIIETYRQGPGGRPELSGITIPSLHSIPMRVLDTCNNAGKKITDEIYEPFWQFDSKWTSVFSGD